MMLLYSPLLTGFALLLSLVPLAVSVLCGNRLARMETEVSRQNESFVAMTKDLLSRLLRCQELQGRGRGRCPLLPP